MTVYVEVRIRRLGSGNNGVYQNHLGSADHEADYALYRGAPEKADIHQQVTEPVREFPATDVALDAFAEL